MSHFDSDLAASNATLPIARFSPGVGSAIVLAFLVGAIAAAAAFRSCETILGGMGFVLLAYALSGFSYIPFKGLMKTLAERDGAPRRR